MNLGILGSGQLGRMLALAAHPLGIRPSCLDTRDNPCAAAVMPYTKADLTDEAALRRFAEGLDVVTYEFENVPVTAAEIIAETVPVYPPPAALAAAQERRAEKKLFQQLDIPTARFAVIDTADDIAAALEQIGTPSIWKTRRFGYDGKGQYVIRRLADAQHAWDDTKKAPAILEEQITFERELSIITVRNRVGEIASYPLTENEHRAGILRTSHAPATNVDAALQRQAEGFAHRILNHLDYVGVLAVELFQVGANLLANEMAPRVHNSGHWSIDGAVTSQFENHLRAVCGYELGATDARGAACMLNLIGNTPDPATLTGFERTKIHLYDKAPRPGRKIGHVTTVTNDEPTLDRILRTIQPVIADAADG
jgi:5-(carboxyamino)imidazole ribonucleotide synthase